RRVIDRYRRVAVASHPVDRTLWIESAIEQIVNPKLLARRAVDAHAVQRHERLLVPTGTLKRVSRRTGRRPIRPEWIGRREALNRARRARDAVRGIYRRRPPVESRVQRQFAGGNEPGLVDPFIRRTRDDD